ncbi:dinitrogenase iron-molybdenum cofactor [Thiobaca trueperi]|uniref:Dinitrogenase iron-molybdenum cofactor n=2 Tax=Thiobaca trueperi TaxID=127458 RepID=A0A4R3N5F8_9GAMM|nr:dinitrogenase iron-molybdenum cofactor [Thiobaca trueperi]
MSQAVAEHTQTVELGPNERLVAVATTGNGQIDQHFGHADDFKVYAVGPDGVRFIATRVVEHYCQGGYGDEDKREVILRALADCSALFVARVGDGPRAKLTAAGIIPVDDYPFGAIEESLGVWYRTATA